jgi:AraC-like DNA-binding protein
MFSFLTVAKIIRSQLINSARSRRNKSLILSPEEIQSTLALLRKSMIQDTLYLDRSLDIGKVVSHIHIPQKTITAVLNQHFEKSFSDFVNEYRVEEFKKRILAAGMNRPVAQTALECGFRSSSEFQRSFRYFTGLSPSEFLLQRVAVKKSA